MLGKIVHVTTAHPRTDTRVYLKEVDTLGKFFPGQVVLIVADGLGDFVDSENRVSIRDIGCEKRRITHILLGIIRAFRLIRSIRPKIVHFHDPELLPLGILIKIFRIKVVYDVHEDLGSLPYSRDWIPKPIKKILSTSLSLFERFGTIFFDQIVVATPKIASLFSAKKVITVQNYPIESELMETAPVPYRERENSFAFVGGVSRIRSAIEMVEAIGLIDGVEVRLELAGGMESDELVSKLRSLGSWNLVTEYGHVSREQMANILGRTRAGLVLYHPLPNHINAQPNKIFEYMSAGLPVIGSDFPLWRSIIDGSSCGLLVDPMEPSAIAKAMTWILEHPEESEQMGRNGYDAVRNKYNWREESKKLIACYDQLLS